MVPFVVKSGVMHMAEAALLWLVFIINISQESIVQPHGMWGVGDSIRYDRCVTNAPQELSYTVASIQDSVSTTMPSPAHTQKPACAAILIITTEAEPWPQPESARAAAKGVSSHDCSYNHSYILSQSASAAVTLNPVWRSGLTSSPCMCVWTVRMYVCIYWSICLAAMIETCNWTATAKGRVVVQHFIVCETNFESAYGIQILWNPSNLFGLHVCWEVKTFIS